MKKVNILVIFLVSSIVISSIFVFASPAEAYGNKITHPNLTRAIAELYNAIYDPDLTQSQIDLLARGSADEDTPPRWINHFYDPTTGREWLGKRLEGVSEETVRNIAKIAFNKEPISALGWVNNQKVQNDQYSDYQGNRAFDSAVLYYSNNETDEAYYSLGYVLHAIEDMAVPAHTRQDTHFDVPVPGVFEQLTGAEFDEGEPYEKWAEQYGNISSELIDNLRKDYQPICSSLESCLIYLANYSNNSFFSQDSILDGEYQNPLIARYVVLGDRAFAYSQEDNLLFIAEVDPITHKQTGRIVDNGKYWDQLPPKAILAGVETLKYFHDQAEKAKNNEITVEKPNKISFWVKVKGISPYGEAVKAYRFFARTFSNTFLLASASRDIDFNIQAGDNTSGDDFKITINVRGVDEWIKEAWDDFIEALDAMGYGKLAFNYPEDPQQSEDVNPFEPPTLELPTLEIPELPELEVPPLLEPLFPRVQLASNNNPNNDSGGGGVSSGNNIIYPKLLISEVQIAGTGDDKDEFLEIYNPNSEEVDLTGWYIQRRTETGEGYSTYISHNALAGEKISAKGYLLIGRLNSVFEGLADVKTGSPLTEGNALVLKNPNGDVVDKVGWGQAQDFETTPTVNPAKGASIGRRWDELNETYFDTDNNASDFEEQTPTPKEGNVSPSTLVVSCSALPNPVEINKDVTFTSLVSGGTVPYVYSWTGSCIGSAANCINSFAVAGTYETTINVISDTQTSSASCSVVVSETPLPEPTDTKAPTVVFDLPTEQQNLNFNINFEITDLSIENVSPSGLSVFQFRWKQGEGDWQEDPLQNIDGAPLTYAGAREFSGLDEITYYFQVKAKDANGNESEWLPEPSASTLVRTPKTILINEIQIDSINGEGGTDDDWVELYNPYETPVSLTGWSIQKHSSSDPCSIETSFYKKNFDSTASIPAKGFFVVVGTQANSSLQAVADMTVGWSLTDDSTIYLVRNQDAVESGEDLDIVDKVGFGAACFPETAPALNPDDAGTIVRKSLGVDTNDNSQDFVKSSVPTPKSDVTIWDATDYVNCGASSNPGTEYYNLLIKWQSSSQGISSYEVQYKKNDGNWMNWFSGSETEKTILVPRTLFNDNIYYFRARAIDSGGIVGEWAEIEIDTRVPVVINEVALFGTNSSETDQWIELYNKSDQDVDVTGWKVISGYGSTRYLNAELSGIIPAKGYFIFEAADDQTISDIAAGHVFLGSVAQSGYLHIADENNRSMDSFYYPWWPNWAVTDFTKDGNYYSMERISPYAFGSPSINWKINDGVKINGTDRNGNPIYGTPGQENSNYQIYTPIVTDFVEDTVLTKDRSPYFSYYYNSYTTVFPNVTLTVEPGVVMNWNGHTGLHVRGTLKAIGTPEEPIFFKSSNEPSIPDSWWGISFSDTSIGSEMDNIIVKAAGSPYGDIFGAGIRATGANISLKNSIISNNRNYGLWLQNSFSIIDNVQFDNHEKNDYSLGAGVLMEGGSPIIQNSSFTNNFFGLFLSSWCDSSGTCSMAAPILENLTFADNDYDQWPVPILPTLAAEEIIAEEIQSEQ
ncbi:MAG: lamin tail domain-containing protein [Candidatus Staskawiczbacteria bacterium]|jgi:hypothetical protein